MTVEALLKPRYKVIADWPQRQFCIGSILHIEEPVPDGRIRLLIQHEDQLDWHLWNIINEGSLGDYPHLFKKLEWWEDRKPEDMPEYLRRVVFLSDKADDIGHIFKAIPGGYRNHMAYGFTTTKDGFVSGFDNTAIECFEPATQAEYESYINNQQP